MQASLFQTTNAKVHYMEHQLGNGKITEFPNAFDVKESAYLLDRLLKLIPWKQEFLKIAGRAVKVPRLQCWMGDRASHYGYSGIRLAPLPWQEDVLFIRNRIETLCEIEFNSVLLNYYRNGKDSVAWHADDENELGRNPIIASASFGAERQFQLRHKHKRISPNKKFEMTLENGSLIVMGEGLQENWLHQIPKIKELEEARINLTFRNIITPTI